MSSYKQCLDIEKKGKDLVLNFYEGLNPCWLNSRKLQEKGDIYFPYQNLYVELKCEAEDKYGNFFIETWSNYPINKGWFEKITADYIFYLFLDTGVIHIIKTKDLKDFMVEYGHMFPEKNQYKNKQKNKTKGVCVKRSFYEKKYKIKKIETK